MRLVSNGIAPGISQSLAFNSNIKDDYVFKNYRNGWLFT